MHATIPRKPRVAGDSTGPLLSALLLTLFFSTAFSAPGSDHIRLNQLGFHTFGPKLAIVADAEAWYFTIRSPDCVAIHFRGELSKDTVWSRSEEHVKIADFSGFTGTGTFVVYVNGVGASHPFSISDSCWREVSRGVIRAFYYQRASTALPSPFAGIWSRRAGHPDTRVTVHASAASDQSRPGARSAGMVFSSPKGWYDAGDYGKYVVNAGITTAQLLLLYEQFPGFFDDFSLNIPESSDRTLPDLLDEIKWELDWLLTMQDPADGGVYHKLTGKVFIGDLAPADANEARYFIGKGSAATFDFTAVCAMASRVYREFLPLFADSCLSAARYAWEWGEAHPDSAYRNPQDVVTGEYGDGSLKDERVWAALELFLATRDSSYLDAVADVRKSFNVPSWPAVGMLGFYSMALGTGDTAARNGILHAADALLKRTMTTPYRTSVNNEFYWGSNGVIANQGVLMLVAYLLTRDIAYLEGAIHSCDYLFGRNATGYSFVTGYGSRTPLNPHHRPSLADGIAPPVPGFLVGGPNSESPRDGENCSAEYPTPRAKAWLDQSCSFTTNEVAINWNSPAAFLAGGVEAVFAGRGFDLGPLRAKYTPDTLPPEITMFRVSELRPDRVTVNWKTTEPSVTTVSWFPAGSKKPVRRMHHPSDDSGSAMLTGLLPGTEYEVTCASIDGRGNRTTVTDQFRTEESELYRESLLDHDPGPYVCGSGLRIRFSSTPGVNARVNWSTGGSSAISSTPATETGGIYAAELPASAVTGHGITYSITVWNETDSLTTPAWSLAPDSLTLSCDQFSSSEIWRMVSLPGLFEPRSPLTAFSKALNDTDQWRFFGYDPSTRGYLPFDTLRSGRGGWLYHRKTNSYTHTAAGIAPDTLFPVLLREGWNCIGNPFPFPIYWDNSLIDEGEFLIRITDSAAATYARRQFFGYRDTLPDMANNGLYFSNRELTSHIYDDSVRLHPWEAYWLFSERDSVRLLLDPSGSRKSEGIPKSRFSGECRSWFCVLNVRSQKHADGPIALGASDRGRDGFDELDAPKPPVIERCFHAGFLHPEWNRASPLFASDIVGYDDKTEHSWTVSVSADHGRPVSLSWKRSGFSEGSLQLLDEISGMVTAMGESGTYSYTPGADETSRKITVFWSRGGSYRPETVSRWSFSRVPGPACRFSFKIPYHCNDVMVRVMLFDLSGRPVRRLLGGKRDPGIHTLTWDGTADNGREVSRGMYIAQFKGGPFTKSINLHLLR